MIRRLFTALLTRTATAVIETALKLTAAVGRRPLL